MHVSQSSEPQDISTLEAHASINLQCSKVALVDTVPGGFLLPAESMSSSAQSATRSLSKGNLSIGKARYFTLCFRLFIHGQLSW